jgi:hypothetical protein
MFVEKTDLIYIKQLLKLCKKNQMTFILLSQTCFLTIINQVEKIKSTELLPTSWKKIFTISQNIREVYQKNTTLSCISITCFNNSKPNDEEFETDFHLDSTTVSEDNLFLFFHCASIEAIQVLENEMLSSIETITRIFLFYKIKMFVKKVQDTKKNYILQIFYYYD